MTQATKTAFGTSVRLIAGALVGVLLAGCERPPVKPSQLGFRGVGMEQVVNPRTEAKTLAANAMPELIPPVKPGGQFASKAYQNVQVLGDLTEDEFTRLMIAITEWVSPDNGQDGQGCAYCHNVANMAEDNLYTKHVARRMLQMTKQINKDWTTHVGQTGVTCYTCHRGKNVPEYIWFNDNNTTPRAGYDGYRNGQNAPAMSVGLSSLPNDPFTALLAGTENIRNQGTTALPTGYVKSIQETERTYGLMMHMSTSLGVNCTFCHNSRAFSSWEQSTPQRVTSWHGIRMVRDLNQKYLEPLGISYPANRLGANGDAPKAYCSTCHQGQSKPMAGGQMWKDYPELDATNLTVALKLWQEKR
jgi:photosynthetic reaction center cytochrome c subunit